MNTNEMTTEELKAELESIKHNFDYKDETWEKIFAIEKELRNRKAIPVYTYDL
jgi:hypothetical protein